MRRLAGEHLIEHGPQRIQIRTMIHRSNGKLLWRHVLWRADGQSSARQGR